MCEDGCHRCPPVQVHSKHTAYQVLRLKRSEARPQTPKQHRCYENPFPHVLQPCLAPSKSCCISRNISTGLQLTVKRGGRPKSPTFRLKVHLSITNKATYSISSSKRRFLAFMSCFTQFHRVQSGLTNGLFALLLYYRSMNQSSRRQSQRR